MAVDRSLLARLKKLLLSRDWESIRQGVELVVSLGDEEVVEALLHGVTYDPARKVQFRSRWRNRNRDAWTGGLVFNTIFKANTIDLPCRDLCALALIGTGLGPTAAALRPQITRYAMLVDDGGVSSLDLGLLQGLPALTHLQAEANNRVKLLTEGMDLPALEEADIDLGYSSTVASLEGFSRSTKLKKLHMEASVVEDCRGLEHTALEELTAEGFQDLQPLLSLPLHTLKLESCKLSTLHGLGRMAQLRSLTMFHVEVPSLRGLEGSPVQVLEMNHLPSLTDLEGLSNLPNLTTLKMGRIEHITSLHGLEGLPKLTSLTAHDVLDHVDWSEMPPLPALERLEVYTTNAAALAYIATCTHLKVLSIGHVRAPTLDALEGLPALESFSFQPTEVEALDHLPSYPLSTTGTYWSPAGSLSFANHPKLTSIRGVASVKGVLRLHLEGCTGLTTLDGVEGLTELQLLDLRNCTNLEDVSALEGLTTIRGILAVGCPILDEDFPDHLQWAISRAAKPDINSLISRPIPANTKPKKRKPPVPPELVGAWEETLVDLQRNTPEALAAIAARAAALQSAAFSDALLQGARWTYQGLQPGSRMKVGKTTRLKEFLTLSLLGSAPPESKVAEKLVSQAPTSLKLQGIKGYYWRSDGAEPSLDVSFVRRLPNLLSLSFERFAALTGVEALLELPALQSIQMDAVRKIEGLHGSRLMALESLTTWRDASFLAHLPNAPKLKQLSSFVLEGERLPDFSSCPAITHLEIKGTHAVGGLEALAGLKRLRELTLPNPSAQVSQLPALPKLTKLTLAATGLGALGGLAHLPALESLQTNEVLTRWGVLPPSLTRLGFRVAANADFLSLPHRAQITALSLVMDAPAKDLSFLAAFPNLQELELRGADVESLDGIEACTQLQKVVMYALKRDADIVPLLSVPTVSGYWWLESALRAARKQG